MQTDIYFDSFFFVLGWNEIFSCENWGFYDGDDDAALGCDAV
jgi:hypothetical protein